MPLIEYKLEKTHEGLRKPACIEKGGRFKSPVDQSFVGYILPSHKRKYYVPNSFKKLSLEDFVKRQLDIHSKEPFVAEGEQPDAESEEKVVTMTNEQVEKQAKQDYNAFYDLCINLYGEE